MNTAIGSVVEQRFSDRETLASTLADEIAAELRRALDLRQRASLVVSGGGTPVPLFHRLRTLPLPWTRIDVTLADERWVDPDHPDSNEGLLRRELLQDAAAEANLVPLKTSATAPEAAEQECATRLSGLARPFDTVILGMGGDGHTASLFPHTAALTDGLQPEGDVTCVACRPETAPHPRLSLTLAALLDTRRLILHIAGEDKWRVYKKASTGTDTRAMPVRALLQQNRTPLHVYWSP